MDSNPLPSTGIAAQLLVVDDDREFHDSVRQTLRQGGYRFQRAQAGRQALREFKLKAFDAILLDLALPDLDGLDVLAEMRNISAVPIVILTARSALKDIEMSFALGADDFNKKPFVPGELIERLAQHALPRASGGLAVGPLRLWPERRLLEKDGQTILLTEVEIKLLHCLMAAPEQPVGAATLYQAAWPPLEISARQMLHMVETAVAQLQNKIDLNPKRPSLIAAAQGGYLLRANPPGEMPA